MDASLYNREHGSIPNPFGPGGFGAPDHSIDVVKRKLSETTLLLEVLAHVNSLMSKGSNFEVFCTEVGKLLTDRLNFKYIHIWLRDENNPSLLKLATPEVSGSYRTTSIDRGLIGRAIREGHSICVPDVSLEPQYVNAHADTKSELCVPLMYEGIPMGVINIETDVLQNFANMMSVLQVIAENLSHSMRVALLYQTEEQFHNLVEEMSEGICITDREGKIRYTNRALQRISGFGNAELQGRELQDFFHTENRTILSGENLAMGSSGHQEATLLGKEETALPVLLNVIPFGHGGSMATITDLRALKSVETKLRQAEQFLASITQHCQEAIIGLDENGVIQSWNVGAERMFGYKAHEVMGQSTHIIVPEDRISSDEIQSIINEAKIKGFVHNFETIRLHKNSKPILISLTMSAIRSEQGSILGYSVLYRDITAQKKWEREIQDRFEKMQEAYREMGKQRRYLDYLTEMITLASSSSSNIKQLATFIVNAIVMITRVDAATIRFLDNKTGKLVLAAQSGVSEDWWNKKMIPYAGSLVETAVKNGHPLKILDVLSTPQYTAPSLARRNNLRSALILPLEVKGEVLGSLVLYLSHESNLSLLDDEFITTFALQASIAIKLMNNADLHNR